MMARIRIEESLLMFYLVTCVLLGIRPNPPTRGPGVAASTLDCDLERRLPLAWNGSEQSQCATFFFSITSGV
jgi:hypothetical protein